MSTVGPPLVVSPISNVKVGFWANKRSWRVSLTRYCSNVSFQTRPNASSNSWHAAAGRYIYGNVESMNVRMGDGSNDVVEPFASLAVMDCRPTTISREMSGAREKDTLLGMNRDAS